jgi:hypothetical protein
VTKPTLDHQASDSENHGDRKTRKDPNAVGPEMSQPYSATSPRFSEDGFDQTWGDSNKLDGETYKVGDYPV